MIFCLSKQLSSGKILLFLLFLTFLCESQPLMAYNDSVFPLQDKVATLHANKSLEIAPTIQQNLACKFPTGLDKQSYLDIIETIVTLALTWVDDKGAIIDPNLGREWAQTTPRFVASAAILLHFDRKPEMLDTVIKSMSYCCKRLSQPGTRGQSPDFWMRELMTAFYCLEKLAPAEVVESWRTDLSAVIPEKHYQVVDPTHSKLDKLHNWVVYAAGGEAMRQALGVTGGDFLWGNAFFDLYMRPQFSHITDLGMYRDPGDPITYDITTRLQLANALYWGYDSGLTADLDEMVRRGGLTTLLFTAPQGFTPYGGRSASFQFQEAIIAALCELESLRYKKSGDLLLAGRFKRMAHLAVNSIQPWVSDQPFRHIKNRFAPETLHGFDQYGHYSVYSLLCSSILGLAALYADDTIIETPTLAENGGYVIDLSPPFHKVIASCGGNYVEIDTAADQNYDATGLGRILLGNLPFGLLPASPIAKEKAKFRIAAGTKLPGRGITIGPTWELPEADSLAAWTKIIPQTNIINESSELVEWQIVWPHKSGKISQRYSLDADKLVVVCQREDSRPFRFTIPVLHFDGTDYADWKIDANNATGKYQDRSVRITTSQPLNWRQGEWANRNGVYRILAADAPTGQIEVTFSR